jgi:hypothetical protein
MALTSDELNYLVYRYLLESGVFSVMYSFQVSSPGLRWESVGFDLIYL